MAFSGSEGVMKVIEGLIKDLWSKILPETVDTSVPFMRMTYNDSMLKVLPTMHSH